VQRVDALEQEAAVRQRELDSALQRVNALEQEAAARQRELEAARQRELEAARQRELEAARQRELEAALQRELEAALQRVNALEQEAAARQCELEAALQRVNALEQEAAARQQRAAPSLVRTLQQPPQELQETPGIQRQQTLDLAQLTHKALRAALRIVFVVNARQARIRVHDTFKSMFNEYVEFAILRQDASNHGDSRLAADAFVSLLSTQFEALQSLPETTQKAREWMDKLVETFRKQVVSSTCCLAA
jgi:chromosome segregation ATPase